ncbi:hypothetical protein HYPSUDRAFT_68504 [Hypholoma sublateritium FD-334 SS-4]|uniref:Uncharacterized protein n=1 Tax=Hypholoma sublateritium (strain FD-334 SS-4) TaxID=945553 RepID=A0A0D2NNT2_HYPSF|nr:hypothetical protein HYPSUDRAFT_68504 [Hypholoma sublateritium FD-334 SS-4]
MSSEKQSLPSIPQSPAPDAPPPYASIAAATATLLESIAPQPADGTTPAQPIRLTDAPPAQPHRAPAPPPKPHTHKRSASASSAASGSLKTKRSWFSFASSAAPAPGAAHPPPAAAASSARTRAEVRSTVAALVSDLVRSPSGAGTPAAAARGVLASCADVCAAHALVLADVLQDRAIEGHSPLYWAIVTRARGDAGSANAEGSGGEGEGGAEAEDEEKDDLVAALLAHCPALPPDAAHELRLACVAAADQGTFQRLRALFAPALGTDAVLLHSRRDDVRVVLPAQTADGAFAVRVEVPQYHRRMMVAREIALEFVARNRIWRLALLITGPEETWHGPPPGAWCIALALQDAASPPAWLDARLFLLDAKFNATSDTASLPLRSKQMLEPPRDGAPLVQVVVPLDGTPFSGLQYAGNPATVPDDTLRLRLEAKLRKPDPFEGAA